MLNVLVPEHNFIHIKLCFIERYQAYTKGNSKSNNRNKLDTICEFQYNYIGRLNYRLTQKLLLQSELELIITLSHPTHSVQVILTSNSKDIQNSIVNNLDFSHLFFFQISTFRTKHAKEQFYLESLCYHLSLIYFSSHNLYTKQSTYRSNPQTGSTSDKLKDT